MFSHLGGMHGAAAGMPDARAVSTMFFPRSNRISVVPSPALLAQNSKLPISVWGWRRVEGNSACPQAFPGVVQRIEPCRIRTGG